ncbi:DUF2188 domain-containing protein [Solitalea agri]|nr:hypothetical protein [Solitalea agri]
MKNLMAPVRYKAIGIANALLEEKYDEQRSIAIAIAKAEEWAMNRNMQVKKKKASNN